MAEMNQNAVTAQAIRRSKSVIVSEGEPDGPGDDRKREACGHHQDRRSLHSVQKSDGDVDRKRPIRRPTSTSVASPDSALCRDAAFMVLCRR